MTLLAVYLEPELPHCGNAAISLVMESLGSVDSCIFKLSETICLQRANAPQAVDAADKGQKTGNQ